MKDGFEIRTNQIINPWGGYTYKVEMHGPNGFIKYETGNSPVWMDRIVEEWTAELEAM